VLTLSCLTGDDDVFRIVHITDVSVICWIGDVVLWN